MISDYIFIHAIKDGFWYKEDNEVKRASPSTDMYCLAYTCEEDAEYYKSKVGMTMKFMNPVRNLELRFTLDNYGELWALTKGELE